MNRKCPKCGAEMEYHEAEPDVGILDSGFECHSCGLSIFDDRSLDDDADCQQYDYHQYIWGDP